MVAGVAASFTAERLLPVDPGWNRDQDDSRRDILHTLVNEGTVAVSLASLPVLGAVFTISDAWPHTWPFAVQVVAAVLVFDLGITLAHRLHHLRWAGVGDVNFGLFTLLWDRLLGTYTPPGRTVTTGELGIAARSDYPNGYLAQLTEPFRRPDPAALNR